MKFINYLESISGISIFPMISLLVFFTFFILLFIRLYFMSKGTIEEISNLPLEDDVHQNGHVNVN
jgi:hypothetical protein